MLDAAFAPGGAVLYLASEQRAGVFELFVTDIRSGSRGVSGASAPGPRAPR